MDKRGAKAFPGQVCAHTEFTVPYTPRKSSMCTLLESREIPERTFSI